LDATLFREPRRRSFALPDGELSALDFGDERQAVDVIFVHANGFNDQTYRQALQPLSGALRILAVDLRGHGMSQLPADPESHKNWNVFADDLLKVIDALGSGELILSGHSMGATTCILAAARSRGQVKSLVLFEPVLLGRARQWMTRLPGARDAMRRKMPLFKQALARRSIFKDRNDAFTAYRGRGAFKTWPESAIADYVAGGFRDREDGTVELACAPAWEAANYTAQGHDPYRALSKIKVPVRILKAEHNSTCSMEPRKTGQANVSVKIVPGSSHFLPMERPDVVRAQLLDAAEA
jgi:pimeloyl-ACP methyl ester carboxylesterase